MTRAAAWGVFLDRDGTLVPNVGHPVHPEQLRFYRATGSALRVLGESGAVLIVVSNQSAVARGLLDGAGLDRMDRRLSKLALDEGAHIDRAYYCPHHPEFTGPCVCRKPAPGMIEAGLRDFRLRARDCFLIGDSISDLEAARGVGVTPVLVLTGRGRRSRGEARERGLADAVVRDVGVAARWILARRESARRA